MIDIKSLRQHYEDERVFTTEHAKDRYRQRGIKAKDIRSGIMTGEIIEQYPEDYPFPSCLVLGKTLMGEPIHIVISEESTSSRIITAYFPDQDKWDAEFKIRKEN